jgi:hypothetical protein
MSAEVVKFKQKVGKVKIEVVILVFQFTLFLFILEIRMFENSKKVEISGICT